MACGSLGTRSGAAAFRLSFCALAASLAVSTNAFAGTTVAVDVPVPVALAAGVAAPMTVPSNSVLTTAEPPTSIAATADGSVLFVGMDRHFGDAGGIAAYRRGPDRSISWLGSGTAREGVQGLALTPDGEALVFTTRSGPGIVSVAAIMARRRVALVTQRDGPLPGSNQVLISPDGKYAFYSNYRDASLGVARIGRRASGAATLTIVAHVPLDRMPGGIAASADGATLYVTSEIDNVDPARVAGADDTRLGRKTCEANLGPNGVLSVIDARRAVSEPGHAVLGRVASGCAPARVALSPQGDVTWVTVRGENLVLAFGTAKLIDDPAHALLAQFAVGPEPIGVLVTHDGKHVAIVASDGEPVPHRRRLSGVDLFDADSAATHSDAKAYETLGAGNRPREILECRDGTIFVTDYGGRAIHAFAPLSPSSKPLAELPRP